MKIKKAPSARHETTLSPFVRKFVAKATAAPIEELRSCLDSFPKDWPFPRGDLYHWIPLLDRFDTILEEQVAKYKLKDGPQTIPFEPTDKALLITIMDFTRLLVEKCGNRSLYASSGYIGDLMNSTDLDIIYSALYLGSRLALRYYSSRSRGSSSNHLALLASHYNINLDKVTKLASPFVKGIGLTSTTTSGGKSTPTKAILPIFASDLGRIARGENPPNTAPAGTKPKGKSADSKDGSWEEWGGAWISYYMNPKAQSSASTSVTVPPPLPVREPTTPTPRRVSHPPNVTPSPSAHRSRHGNEDTPQEPVQQPASSGLQTLEISASRIREAKNLEEIISSTLPELPADYHYEFLHRLRVAKALGGDLESRRKILGIRILALTNLAYVLSETQFQAKVLNADNDEPRRVQLAYQFAELLHSGEAASKESEVPRWLQTLAIGGLEALGRHKNRLLDISNALSLNVNHGVLLYIMRKLLAELSSDDDDDSLEAEEWRESLFSLVTILPTFFHIGTSLVSAGLIGLLIDMIKLRTQRGLRHLPKAINVLDQLIYGIPNAFQSLANAHGLDAVVDLVDHEIKAGLREIEEGTGITEEFSSQQTHYRISHPRQQTLKMVTKFMQHIMSQSGNNVDRLLRNLIDNPKLLESIRIVIGQSDIWGSNIWSTVVHMISSFIHNEPTSYAVVHEAHITHALLEAVTGQTGLAEKEAEKKKEEERRLAEEKAAKEKADAAAAEAAGSSEQHTTTAGTDQPSPAAAPTPAPKEPEKEPEFNYVRSGPPAAGIMASGEAIGIIPTAFGAICLNPAGLALIQSSGALYSYFEIFESPAHVKILSEGDLDNVLGNQFDELVRHHPVLKDTVMKATLRMLDNVSDLGRRYAVEHGIGAKIWLEDGSGGLIVSGGRDAIIGKTTKKDDSKGKEAADGDVEMTEAGPSDLSAPPVEIAPTGAPIDKVVTLADVHDDEDEARKGDLLPLTDFIDVAARFLEGFIQNVGQTREFLQRGGLQKLLDIHHLPSLPYDFATSQANQTLCRAIQMCCEHSLVETLKVVFQSAQKAIEPLEPLLQHVKEEPFFAPLTTPDKKNAVLPPRLQGGVPAGDDQEVTMTDDDEAAEANKKAVEELMANGTTLIKNLVTMHSVSYLLQDLFHQPLFTVRQHVQLFLATTQSMDKEGLMRKLGLLQRQCVWEEILLQNSIPSTWDVATRNKDAASPTVGVEGTAVPAVSTADATLVDPTKTGEKAAVEGEAAVEKDGKTSWFRNVKTIRYLIGQIPMTINPFMQGLAKSLISRRSSDMQQKYLALRLIDAISDSMYTNLTWERVDNSPLGTERYGYWIIMLTSLMNLLLDGITNDVFSTPKSTPLDRQLSAITSTVVTFKQKNGLEVVKKILRTFWDELQTLPPASDSADIDQSETRRMAHSYGGIKVILSIFAHLVSSKAVIDSNQSQALHVRVTSDFERSDYFNTFQLLVELRATILPIVKEMWDESSIEKASSSVVKSVVEILGTVLKGDNEAGAFTTKDVERRPGLKNVLSWKNMIPREEQIKKLMDMGFGREAASDALIRSRDNVEEAITHLSNGGPRAPHFHSNEMDEDEDDEYGHEDDDDDDGTDDEAEPSDGTSAPPPPAPEPPTDSSTESSMAPPPLVPAQDSATTSAPTPAPQTPARVRIEDLVTPVMPTRDESTVQVAGAPPSAPTTEVKGKSKEDDLPEQPRITVEDLDTLREGVRGSLINRCLDIIQGHDSTVFELADLLKSSFHQGGTDVRKEVVSTIIQSLLSLQMDDDFRPKAKTIAATAHLLGLIIQDNEFYESAVEDLKEHFGYLVAFVKIYPGDPAPWVPKILLILEKLLSENAQPDKLDFTMGQTEKVVENSAIKIEDEDQESLFSALVSILPHIAKDDILPLAVARILVLLTRKRNLAIKMTEDGNLQKVFHMYRRQAGTRVDRLQSSLMILLRHIVEDDETIKTIMKAEIRQHFLNRTARNLDTRSFTKGMANCVLRNPDIFVEVVNDLCKLPRYDQSLPTQIIVLKEEETRKEAAKKAVEAANSESSEEKKSEEEPAKESAKEPANEENSAETSEKKEEGAEEKKATVELRAPGVENPDGVIHFLLTELFAIKDVRDVPPPTKPEEATAETATATTTESAANETTSATGSSETPANAPAKSDKKPEFKVEHHQYFFYRAFLLMSLAELVCCYNRCKVEFINYNRKASGRDPITPSKPRSAVFNYLLNDIIAQQSLDPLDDIDKKKKSTLAEWSQGVFVSLCTHTGEEVDSEEEPELLFVRKFVCETSLKAFKDACASSDPLDIKYARMMNLSETFYRILSGVSQSAAGYSATSDKSQFQLAKIMLEKNYISALTSALADVDLNFPDASKKVIKYMLKTLKLLSKTAVDLGDTSSLATPGTTDEDDIMTASSISDIDDMREETPDLYRNSTLGLFEGNEMGDEDEGSYDEDDDEEMYDEDIGFEEELEEDGESDLSEDDDDVEDDGTVEVIVEGPGDDMDSDDEDDDDSSDDDMDGDEIEIEEHSHHHHHHHHDDDEYDTDPENDWASESSDDEGDDDDISNNPLETIARALGVGENQDDGLDDDREDGFIDDEADDDDDMDDDEEEDDLDEEEAMLQEQFDEDEDDEDGSGGGGGWGWDHEDAPTLRAHPRGGEGWFTLTGSPREPPAFITRNGRPRNFIGGPEPRSRTGNQNLNPLLQQSDPDQLGLPQARRSGAHPHAMATDFMNDWVQAMDGMQTGGQGPVSVITSLMSLMNRGGALPPQAAIHFQATVPHHVRHFPASMHRDFRSMFGSLREPLEPPRHRGDFEAALGSLDASATNVRWTQEAEVLFGSRVDENALRILNTLLFYMVPPALEEQKILQEKEEKARAEAARIAEEKAKEEEERKAKEKAEAEEKAKKEAEEREAAERARAEAESRAAEIAAEAPTEATTEAPAAGEAMEGVQSTTEETTQTEAGPSEPQERAVVTIRGQEMDITGMGIDPEFLEAIPEDMREEALTHHIRERRAAAVENNQPSEISREFLDALPDEIREELIEQENADRRRREQETARGTQGGPMDIDLATFLATLDPGLRQTVLMEQDDEALAHLPQAIVEEANALRGERSFTRNFGDSLHSRGAAHATLHGRRGDEPKPPKKPVRKGTIQLLDKAGVATLLRLMFIPQIGTTRVVLHEILHNICENRQNRAEVVNLLLSVLQDGSADMVAVERSFAQLSVRAKTPALQKTPSKPSLSRTNTGSGGLVLAQASGEITPLMVAHQCINALLFLVNYNEHIPSYFLNEHDISTGLKRSLSRKGKGKAVDNKSSKYALNTLLGLLDRPLITESTIVMEQLAILLSEITRPLTILLKKDKKKAEEDKAKEQAAIEPAPEASASTEQPAAETTTTQEPTATEPSTEAGAASSSATDKKEPEKKEEETKKTRNLVPPVVPEHNLQLVVNILTARECPSKTFRETLATMQNLSGIPGAKDVFGVELIRQAQVLGGVLLEHLDGLLKQIKSAENGTEVQGMALANFSPASSEQAKLLRVLTALDYLFDPKRNKDNKPEEKGKEKEGTAPKAEPPTDVLAKLHNSLVFAPLWEKLSECLTAIHEREDLLHIATILLPSIEGLMVICKNCGLDEKDKGTPVPEAHAGMRKLFFSFTEDHRKILNQMVRNNPKLMSGSFCLLVNNPKVLDFDNKRNYFSRKLHTRGVRDSHGTLQLNVRRDQVFMDSYKSMYYKSGDEIKYAKLSIRFSGEEGVDAGGVTREWFQVMARQMFNPGYALFIPVASDRTTFHPNSLSGVNAEHLHFFKFIGRIIGKALYENRVLDCHFSRAVYKMILGKSVSLKDMETLDLEYYKSLVWMLENDITDIITETFSVDIDEFGARRTIDLIENGHNIPVTEENKHEYVRLMTEHRLLHSVKEQIDHFLIGFFDIVPANLINIFNEQELELLISGMPDIDMDDWRNNTEYHNYSASSPQIQWFWRAVRSFDKEERAKLLQFVTGTSKVPLNGFKELEGMNGFSKFNIHRDYGSKDRLPSSHTCFNQLDLPEYESYEQLRQQLLTAITQGADYFGFA